MMAESYTAQMRVDKKHTVISTTVGNGTAKPSQHLQVLEAHLKDTATV